MVGFWIGITTNIKVEWMPRGINSENDPRRRPKIIDLDHFRQTREVKDVQEVNEMRRTENIARREERSKTKPKQNQNKT